MGTLAQGRAGLNGDLERRRRQTDAGLKLAFLPRYDRLIESYDRLASREDLTEAQIAYWRRRRRDEYRAATGVEMEQRDALREKLAEVVETGSMTVKDVIEQVRRGYANGSLAETSKVGEVGASADDWL